MPISKPIDPKPTDEEIERYKLRPVELWLSIAELYRVMAVYYRNVELRNDRRKS